MRPPKVPEPQAYGGEEDIKVFEGWLGNILRWFSINRYCGPDFDEDHVVCTAMFLKDTVLMWYGDNVDGGSHRNCEWSFKKVVIGLYDHFIHQGALRSASDAFQSAMYIPEKGVMAFYHKMTRYAAQIVRPPNRYTFKRQFIMRLPRDIFDYLLSKEVSAECSTMELILHHAGRVEENARQMLRWLDA